MPQIITASTALHLEPDAASNRETDALYGETVAVHGETDGADGRWCEVTLETDGYRGWLKKDALGQLPEASHRVITPRALLTQGADIKTPAATRPSWLPMAARLAAKPAGDGIMAVEGKDGIIGYLPAHHLLALGATVPDWVAVAESLIGVPYRWGGRDSIGIDCSALVQLGLAAAGQAVKRNSGDQEATIGVTIDPADGLERGDLVFWKGHVGLMLDGKNLLHANMHHARSAVEPLTETLARFEANGLNVSRFARP